MKRQTAAWHGEAQLARGDSAVAILPRWGYKRIGPSR